MHIAVRHNLQVFDPADPSLCESGAIVLPIAEAQAAMGETVATYLARVAWRFELPTVCRINGEFYARAEWEARALAVNDDVEFISRPLGGGSSGGSTGKSILSVVALVALTAVAPYAVGAIGGALGTTALGTASALTFAGKLASAVIVGAGALAVSHFLSPKSGGKTNSTDALYSFGLQGNAARPMQPIPVLNGRLRFAPDYAAPTYSEYAGDAMTDYALYALTCGRMRVEQVLIGDTPIWHYQTGYSPDYPGIELQIVEPGEQVTLYPVNVVTADELSGAELSQDWTPGYIINAAGTRAKELLFDFVWPGGAYVTFKDRTLAATTHVQIRVRQVDDAGAPTSGWVTIVDDQYQLAKQSQIRLTVRRLVESGRYEVSGRRANPSVNDSGVEKIGGTDDVTWTAARAHIEGPQSFPRVTTLAVKGVASKQLSGVSGGQLRVIGTRILPVWRDGQFVEEPTRSIAWATLDWWRNGDYAAGLSISDIDFQSFVRHAALWDALGHTFDHRFTEVQNLDDVLETVLKAGRAFPAPVGDKLTITRDEPRVLPRMLFTDNDIVRDTLEIDYALSDEAWADGMVGEYVDETTWRLAEVSSAPDGVTLLKPARVQLEGVVGRKQAAGMVRMMAAESQYRRITVSWTARMEGRLLKRGDLVRITTEEPETWGQSCEVAGFDPTARRLTLDPAPEWAESGNHYVEIRRRDGSPWGPVQVTRGASDAEAIVSVPEAGGVTLADAVARSDTQERAWLAFSPSQPRSFPVLITDGDPDQDGEHIHLSGVMDAAEVYATTEDGVPPLLQIPDLFSSALPVIAALMAQINQRQASLILTAGWQPAKNAVTYEAQVSYDAGATWIGAYEGDRTTFEAVVGGSDRMMVRVRGVTPAGPRGAWSVVLVEAPSFVIPGELVDVSTIPPIPYDKLAEEARERIEAAQAKADEALAEARTRIDELLRSLAIDPNVRQGYVNAMVGDVQSSISLLADVTTRLLGEVAVLRDRQAAAGIEVLSDQGVVRIAGLAKLETEVGTRFTSLSVTVDALKGQIESYGSVQTGDLSGLVTSINVVRERLDAVSATISQLATSAQFTEASTRIGAVETSLDAVNAEIRLKAAQAEVDAQGITLRDATLRLSAAEGRISTVVQSAGTGAIDAAKVPRLLSQLYDLTQNQIGALTEAFARVETNTSANIDEAGRATAELSSRLLVVQGESSAQYVTVTKAVADTNDAMVRSQTLLLAQIGDVSAGLTREEMVRASAVAAQTTRVDGALSRVGSVEGRIGTAEGRITGLDETFAGEREATARRFGEVGSRFDRAEGRITSLAETQSSDRENTSRSFSAVSSRFDESNANIRDVRDAQTSASRSQSELNTQLFARTDAGTAEGRIRFGAVSAPDGVAARFSIQLSTERNYAGSFRASGLFMDILTNGETRTLIDANLFAITANGGLSYPFTFDGETLRVPRLVLTSGQASTPLRVDIGSYTLVAGPGTLNDQIDANLNFTFNVSNPDFPSVLEMFGRLTISGPTGTGLQGIRLLLDGQVAGYVRFNEQTAGPISPGGGGSTFDFRCQCIRYLTAGNHSVRIQYSYTSPGAGQVQINELHIAGFTPRA